MSDILIRFYADLNDHLPDGERYRTLSYPADRGITAGECLSRFTIPDEEVELVLVNGISVAFDHRLEAGDRVSVYPVFESFDVTSMLRVRSRPLRRVRFILDVHLGKLAHHLRMLGFDTDYENDCAKEGLVRRSMAERRTLLSRDRLLVSHPELTHAFHIRSPVPEEQLREVVERFDLRDCTAPFSRCLLCNEPVRPVVKELVAHRLPGKVRQAYQEFWSCPACDRIYWHGSHWEQMNLFIQRFLSQATRPEEGNHDAS